MAEPRRRERIAGCGRLTRATLTLALALALAWTALPWALTCGTAAAAEAAEAATRQSSPPRAAILSREEMHRWDRHVRGFRREHNFGFSFGVTSGTWNIERFASLEDREFDNSGLFARFQYSFHLPIYQGFGYLLGSSGGYHYESADARRAFRPVASWQFPGILIGLVYNINSVLRTSLAVDSYLERHNGLEAREGRESSKIHVTVRTFDAGAFVDVFYDLSWALRLEAHRRRLIYQRPFLPEDSGTPYAVDAIFTKDDQWLGLGLVFHLI